MVLHDFKLFRCELSGLIYNLLLNANLSDVVQRRCHCNQMLILTGNAVSGIFPGKLF